MFLLLVPFLIHLLYILSVYMAERNNNKFWLWLWIWLYLTILSFTFSTWTIPTLTATLSPPGILKIGPELLLTTHLENPPLWFVVALVNKLVPWCAWLLSSALEVLRLRLRLRFRTYFLHNVSRTPRTPLPATLHYLQPKIWGSRSPNPPALTPMRIVTIVADFP